jgi:hypothetical protein
MLPVMARTFPLPLEATPREMLHTYLFFNCFPTLRQAQSRNRKPSLGYGITDDGSGLSCLRNANPALTRGRMPPSQVYELYDGD